MKLLIKIFAWFAAYILLSPILGFGLGYFGLYLAMHGCGILGSAVFSLAAIFGPGMKMFMTLFWAIG